MDQVLLRMLKESANLYAEAMFYQLAASSAARSATAKQARAIVMNLVRKLGLNPNSYRFADGSGLSFTIMSRQNLRWPCSVTPTRTATSCFTSSPRYP